MPKGVYVRKQAFKRPRKPVEWHLIRMLQKIRLPRFCSIDGCLRVPCGSNKRCPMHEARLNRKGTTGSVESSFYRIGKINYYHTGGYIRVYIPGHPLANKQGIVFQHRLVLYDKIGAAPHRCYWCGLLLLDWKDIVSDHVDNTRTNNQPINLVPACMRCNTERGAMVSFLARHNAWSKNYALAKNLSGVQGSFKEREAW